MENWDLHGIEGPNERGSMEGGATNGIEGLSCNEGYYGQKGPSLIKNAFMGKRPLQEKGALIGRKDFHEKKGPQ